MRTLVASLLLLAAVSRAEPQTTVTLSGSVIGASGLHTVHVALWDAAGFLRKPIREVQLTGQATPRFQFTIPAGRWTVSAYEDRNENGVLDMGLFGPKEPSGFWRPFNGWHKPRFDEVASDVKRDISDATVTLK
jgi:uncharacterized protein (DUF2141 family)